MPQIPLYNRRFDKGSVDLNAPKQNLNAPIEAFGGGDGKALESFGRGVSDLGRSVLAVSIKMKEEEDDAKSLDAYLRYHDSLNVYLQGDGSEGSGVYNRLGGSAVGSTKDSRDYFEKTRQDIAGTLENDRQRTLFNKRAQPLRSESLASVARFEAGQRREYQAEMYKAQVGKEADYAVLNFTNPGQVNAALARQEEAARAFARMKGMSPEATEQTVKGFQSAALKSVAMRYVENNAFGVARSIMQDPRMTGEDVAKVEASLKAGTERAQSYNLFQDAMGQDDPLAWLRTKKDIDPVVRDQAEQRIKSEIQWQRTEQHEAERQTAKTAEDSLVRALDAKDIDTANRLVEDAPAGLRKEFRAYMTSRLKGKDIVDDPAEKWRWTQMLADNPEKFKQEWNSPAMIAKLSPETRGMFDKAYVELGKANRKPLVDEVITDKDIINNAATVLGIKLDKIKDNTDVAQKYGTLEREYTRLVEQETAAKGRKLTSGEKQKLVDDNILYKGRVKGAVWGSNEAYRFNAMYEKNPTFRPDPAVDPYAAVSFEARKQGVSDSLARAVMQAESNGNQSVVSNKGAIGLMQLMPGTAKYLGVNPKDPEQNIQGGVRYLKQMIDKYKDERLALLAYNWGPGSVDRWMAAGMDPAAVPAESVNYVRKVLSNTR